MTSLYLDIMVSNQLMASVSIRKMNLLADKPTWAYEIVQTMPKAAPVRGTVEDDGEDRLYLVHQVLSDYFSGRKAYRHDHSDGV